VFSAGGRDQRGQAAAIEELIRAGFELEVPVLVLDARELAAIAEGNPFAAERLDARTLHVTYLFEPVDGDAFASLALPAADGERAVRSEARARAAAFLLLTLRGTPFLYQGEELGLLDAVVPEDRALDPGGRDGCRSPIPWDGSADHGWPTDAGRTPWLPFPPDAGHRNHAALREDPGSILHLYRRLLALRKLLGQRQPRRRASSRNGSPREARRAS